jgi:hypothetical protein
LPNDLGAFTIRFDPNGTYIDIADDLPAGTSKTYSVRALGGQVMSVSIHQSGQGNWTLTPLAVTGADGAALCPSKINGDCYFWRGVLPATQDYFITVSPVVAIHDFRLRVAINPPGTATQSFLYVSESYGASFRYTDEFAPVRFQEMIINKFDPEVALQFIDSGSIDNTNLGQAYFLFGASHDSALVESCIQPVSLGGPETVTGEVNIGGVSFTRSEAAGVGAGNLYEQTYYRAAYNGVCYEATFFVHSTNIGNYPPETGIEEFDRAALIQKMEGILSTLVIK